MGLHKTLISGFFLIALTLFVTAQKGIEDGSRYGHGKDSVECVKSFSIAHDFVKQRNYKTALPYWQKAFNDCPLAVKYIYLDGVKIYKNFLNRTVSDTETDNLLDTLMLIYDRRIQYFNEVANVRGRQGVDLLRYGRNKTENIEKAYSYLKEAIDIEKVSTSEPVLASYFSSSIILYQTGIFQAGTVIEDYLLVSDLIDMKIDKKPNDKELIELKSAIDDNFINQGPGECETLISFFTKEMLEKNEDIPFLRMLTSLLEKRNCTNADLYSTALRNLQNIAPSSETALKAAIQAYKKNKYTLAIEYYQQALTLETEEDKKADYYFGMAANFNGLKNKPKARELALKAIDIRPAWGEPYILIGQMYADSKDDCSSIRLPNSIFWAAVDKFMKAKIVDPSISERANSLILAYSPYFPNKEEAFFENVHEGYSFTVGCWINETTQARFND